MAISMYPDQTVTQCQSTDEGLQTTNQALDALIDASPAAIVCVDGAGKVSVWNPAAERTFGWRKDEMIGQPLNELVPEHEQETYRNVRASTLRGDRVSGLEVQARRKDGSLIDVSVSTAPLRGTDGEISGAMDIILDITTRKQAEAQIRLLATALESAANAVVITDRAGTITWVNPAFTTITGYSAAEALGLNPRMLASGNHSSEFYESMWSTILAGQVWQGEIINRHRNGGLYTESQTITPVRDEKGEISHFIAIKQDMTEQKQMERQLRQAQKMEAVGQLAGGVAHDFNNLLGVIIGYSELLLDRLDPVHPAHKDAEQIKKAGNRAASLTRQLLAFSRKQVLQPKVLDLNTVLAETEKLLRRLIGEDIELLVVPGQALGRVKADPGQLEQIVMNLAVNARDAMPQGGKLTIETMNVDLDKDYAIQHLPTQPGAYVMLAMTDTGCGMDAETQAHIFEPFFTTKEGKGTGLGLSMVYGIVKQSGGYIWVYSELERGTAFKIYLPRVDAHEIVESERPCERLEKVNRGSETILIVEDDADFRTLTHRSLEEVGYAILEAESPAEAARISEQYQGPIHLMVTDVVMPGMSGCDLANHLTQIRPEMRVLYVSGYTDDAILHHGVLEPGVAFLPKPFSPKALARKVGEVLDAGSLEPSVKPTGAQTSVRKDQ